MPTALQPSFGSLVNDIIQALDFHGTAGHDSIKGGVPSDRIFGGGGADTIAAGSGHDCLYGEDGSDSIFGESGRDTIFGGIGNDTIDAGADNDSVDGGIGNDFLDGGAGTDRLAGGQSNDTLIGHTGGTLAGDDGDDVFYRGDGGTGIDGGAGRDEIRMETFGSPPLPYYLVAEVDLESHVADIVDQNFRSTIHAANVVSNVENIIGTNQAVSTSVVADVLRGDGAGNQIWGLAGRDLLDGRGGDDSLDGGSGADTLFGREGDDDLAGGEGNDRLEGGQGIDDLTGGAGRDLFAFDDGDSPCTHVLGFPWVDVIRDFQPGEDHVSLIDIDANTRLIGDQDFAVVEHFTGAGGELVICSDSVYLGGNVYLEYGGSYILGDTDGDRVADLMIHVEHVSTLTAADFIL